MQASPKQHFKRAKFVPVITLCFELLMPLLENTQSPYMPFKPHCECPLQPICIPLQPTFQKYLLLLSLTYKISTPLTKLSSARYYIADNLFDTVSTKMGMTHTSSSNFSEGRMLF